ncbi:hypothetical protein LJK88_20730 [Paenibacillus sp. P26]|nr:hypothetical protein LJK88_20730 [Paenibacillus sp. P26]
MRLGRHVGFEIKVNDRDLVFFVETLKHYKLNIYDSYKGQKKSLASKTIQWFETVE